MKPGILLSSPDLRPSLMSVLKGLDEAHLLKQVVTTVGFNPEGSFGKLVDKVSDFLPTDWQRGIDRRRIPNFLIGKTQTFPQRELTRLSVSRLGNEILSHKVWFWAERGFDREVADRFGGRYECVYGVEHSSLETFKEQKKSGGLCILRQVMAHARKADDLFRREVEKFPDYEDGYTKILKKDAERIIDRKEKEYRIADLIVANSEFVKESFVQAGVDPEKIIAVPTGCPRCSDKMANAGRGNKPLVFLFVGALSLRKGLPYLIGAWNMLDAGKSAELWLVGSGKIPHATGNGNTNGIRHFGPVSKSKLDEIYAQADVLVLPTLLEGLAHVVLEGLSYGMPVMTTRESGCGDLVQNGRNGFMVESANVKSLCNAMSWCLGHREQLVDMGKASSEQAEQWSVADSNRMHLDAIRQFHVAFRH